MSQEQKHFIEFYKDLIVTIIVLISYNLINEMAFREETTSL